MKGIRFKYDNKEKLEAVVFPIHLYHGLLHNYLDVIKGYQIDQHQVTKWETLREIRDELIKELNESYQPKKAADYISYWERKAVREEVRRSMEKEFGPCYKDRL